MDVNFHPEAAARFNQLAEEALRTVRSFGPVQRPPQPIRKAEIHPVANITAEDIIGEITVTQHSVNRLGEETGRFWDSNGLQVGWEGDDYRSIKDLVQRFESVDPIRGLVSPEFLVEEVFDWLKERLEAKRSDSLTDCIAKRCSEEIRTHEIWIPVYRTYSEHEFRIGEVTFRPVSKAILDRFFSNLSEEDRQNPKVSLGVDRKRARIQGSIAACMTLLGEIRKAREIARLKANEAIGLLRFISFVNWTCKLVSHSLPVGMENTQTTNELLVEDGAIRQILQASIEQGPSGWNINEARSHVLCRGVLELLHDLASRKHETDFRRDLYGALILYNRHSVAADISHKMVIVTAAIESMLLKDSQEPIQKNLGERMAFLIGTGFDERKNIVTNVEEFYRIRSAFVHHARNVAGQDEQIVDTFFFNVWLSFVHLLSEVEKYKSRIDLFAELDIKKLS